ncbi:hypothetical protein JTB14_017968, partial [Gonioctena quinquepunctata]
KGSEHVFYDSRVTITIISNEKPKTQTDISTKKPRQEKVFVKADGRSFAELLKTVKEKVNLQEKGLTMKNLKRSNKGDLLMEVVGGRKQSEILREEITRNSDLEVQMTLNQATVLVNDIDADLNPEQIKEHIGKAWPAIDVGQIKITSIKSNRNGSQTAIIEIDTLDTLIGDGRIRIGWVACRAYPKMVITRCYRCLDVGHRASECKGEDRSNACINFGKAGHKGRLHGMPHVQETNQGKQRQRCAALMNFLQINPGRTKAAHDAANLVISEKKIDLLIVSEPNKKIVSVRNWLTDKKLDVAVR